MRKNKIESLKSKSVMVTAPKSFIKYAEDKGYSFMFQRKVAEDVLGMTYSEYKKMMSWLNDTRYKKDSLEVEFVRTARWILESTVKALRRSGGRWEVYVHWHVPDVTNCVVVRDNVDTFNHVCYDAVVLTGEEVRAQFNDDIELHKRLCDSGHMHNADAPKFVSTCDIEDWFLATHGINQPDGNPQDGKGVIYGLNSFKTRIMLAWLKNSGWVLECREECHRTDRPTGKQFNDFYTVNRAGL